MRGEIVLPRSLRSWRLATRVSIEETDDLAGVLKELRARGGTPEIVASDAIDMKNVGAFVFTPVAEKVMAKDVKRPRRAA